MKNAFLTFFFLFAGLLSSLSSLALENPLEIDWFDGSFEEAKELAATSGKLLLVDFYATWCGPCNKMFKEVLSQDVVIDFINNNYVAYKVDIDKESSSDLEKKYGLKYVPTFIVANHDGEEIDRMIGFKPVELFLETLTTINSKAQSTEAEEEEVFVW